MNKKIYKVTQTQLSSLQSNGFITVDGVRYNYDPNSLYILADPFAPEYRIETQGHNLHLLKDNVIISDLTVPFAQASVYASNAKNLQNKTGSKAYTYYDILPRVDYKDFLLIKDLPMEGIFCGFVRNGYFYKVREEDTTTDIPFTLFCQTIDGYYSLSTSEITTPIEGYTIHSYFNEAKFTPYGSVKTVNNTEPDSSGNVSIDIPAMPTVNNGRLIIKKNGVNQAIFTANQSEDTTADIWVPMKTSELTNDSEFVKNADILLPFSQLSTVRIANLNDALWCADKRFYVIASVHPITVNGVTYPHTDTSKAVTDDNYIVDSTPTEIYNSIDNANIISNLFVGGTDTGFNRYVSSDNYIKIRILPIPDRQDNYSPSGSSASFSNYPYGGFVLTTYFGEGASNVKYACYNKWKSHGVGWKFHDCVNVGPKDSGVGTWRIDDEGNYQRTAVDFWFIGTGDTTKRLRPTSIYWIKYRPTDVNDENSYFSKYVDEDLVNDVSWKQRGVTTAKISATGSANFKSITEDGQTLTSKYLRAGATASDSAKLNGQPSSHYLTSIKMNRTTKTSTNSTVDLGNVCTYTNLVVENKLSAASKKMEEITWDVLKFLKDSGKLTPGMHYRITDYTTMTNPSLDSVQSAGHQFDIVVIADGPNTLNENATAVLHSGDTYFKDCDLNSWRLKYCLDNDRSRFHWAADEKEGRGVIYWMEDEFHNQVPYDFKNIMFKRFKVNKVGSDSPVSFDTFFNGTGNLTITDCISPATSLRIADITRTTFIWCYTFCTFEGDDPSKPLDASLNLFPDDIAFQNPKTSVKLYAYDNIIEPLVSYQTITNPTKKVDFQELNNIVFMKYDKDTTNDFGVFGNRFSSSCQSITLGRKCYSNVFNGNNVGLMVGYGCARNTFNSCGNSAIAYKCVSNVFGGSFGYNLVFNNCRFNTFGMKCQHLELYELSYFNTFENDISYVRLVANATGSEPLQYVTVSTGVKGTGVGNGMLHLSQPRGLTHTVTYRRVQSETIDV